jgi:outer membrane protein assembly factor BamD
MHALFRLRNVLMVVAALLVAGCGAHVIPEVRGESERLATAQRLMNQGDWLEASELLKTYIANNAGQAQVDEAVYLLGRCYLEMKDYPLSQGEFERLLRDYPESDSAGSASFRLGEALIGQSRPRDFDQEFTERAVEQWQSYLRNYPGHWLNGEADRRLLIARTRMGRKLVDNGNLYLRLKLWRPARVYFERVTTEYGDTPAAPEAELGLGLVAAKEDRRDEAIERFKAIEARYAGQSIAQRAARERSRLEKS